MNDRDSRRTVRIILLAIGAFAVYEYGKELITMLGGISMMLLLSWLLSITMEPPVAWFERRGYRRGLGAAVVLLAGIAFLVGFLGGFGGLMFSQLSQAVQSAPAAVTTIVGWLNGTFDLQLNAQQVVESLNLDTASITPLLTNLAGGVLGIVSSLLTTTFEFLTILMFAFYFSADAPKLKRGIASWLAQDRQRVFVEIWGIAVNKAGGFVVSRVVLATFSAIAHSAFFWWVGVPYWLPMGLFAGITAQFIPTIGTHLGIAVPALFTIAAEPLDALWIVLFATGYQQVENYVLTPRVSRATMDMHPAVALGSVLVGAAVFGPIGALIGIPIVAVLLAVADTYGHRHELIADLAPGTEADAG